MTVGPIHTANVPLAARVGTGRLTRFWGGEEQNHNDNAQTHHETKENLSQIVSHQHHSPLWVFARGLWANRLLCNRAPSDRPVQTGIPIIPCVPYFVNSCRLRGRRFLCPGALCAAVGGFVAILRHRNKPAVAVGNAVPFRRRRKRSRSPGNTVLAVCNHITAFNLRCSPCERHKFLAAVGHTVPTHNRWKRRFCPGDSI